MIIVFFGNLAWSFPSWRKYFTQRLFSYPHGTIKLCINVHWINKDSVWNVCMYVYVKPTFEHAAELLHKAWEIALKNSAEIEAGLTVWWQTINRNLFRMSSAESIPFTAWWPSPCRVRLTDWFPLSSSQLWVLQNNDTSSHTYIRLYILVQDYRFILYSIMECRAFFQKPFFFWVDRSKQKRKNFKKHWQIMLVLALQLSIYTLFDYLSALCKWLGGHDFSC